MHCLLLFSLIKFVCNAKKFANAFLFFSSLFLFSVFGRTTESFLANVLRSVTKEVCDKDLTRSLDTPKVFL